MRLFLVPLAPAAKRNAGRGQPSEPARDYADTPRGLRLLYVGVTSDIACRVSQHREVAGSTFTARYGVKRLVWYEHHSDITSAIAREKRLKKWPRNWKVQLIEARQPGLGRPVSLIGSASGYWIARSTGR